MQEEDDKLDMVAEGGRTVECNKLHSKQACFF